MSAVTECEDCAWTGVPVSVHLYRHRRTHADGRVAQCFGGALVMRVTGRAHRRRMGLLAVMGLPVLVGLASADQAHDVAADALVAGAAGGWLDSSPASEALEALLGDDTCTI